MDKTPAINNLVRSCYKQLQISSGNLSGIPMTHQLICTSKRNQNLKDMFMKASHSWFCWTLSRCMFRVGFNLTCNQDNSKCCEGIFFMKLAVNDHHQYISLEVEPSGVIKWVCSPIHTHTNPWGRLAWSYAIFRLTAHFMCGLISDLVICKFRKVWSYMTSNVLTETRCH